MAAPNSSSKLREVDGADIWPADAGAPAMQLLDVRAPIEVARSALPGAISAPILTDSERHDVGLTYRQHGHDAAVALAIEQTAPHRDARIAHWREIVAQSERPVAITCWRGGERSRTACEWLADDNIARVRGGAKALRRFLLHQLEERLRGTRPIVLAGLTGAGKTELLHDLARAHPTCAHAVDLEGLANHRGSAFGAMHREQPAQPTFESHLGVAMQLASQPITLFEDESRSIGKRQLPGFLHKALQTAEILLLEVPLAERVARIAHDYAFAPSRAFGRTATVARLLQDLGKLHKRLGGERTAALCAQLRHADHDDRWFDVDAHAPWIEPLLTGYYDLSYSQAVARMDRRVLARGDANVLRDWLGTVRP